MDVPQTTPQEAFETLRQRPDAVYLDVRTEDEFAAGHPAGARNAPVFFFDAATGRDEGRGCVDAARARADDEDVRHVRARATTA